MPNPTWRIAAIQMNSTADVARNLAQARKLFERAAQKNPQLIAFPENFLQLTEDRSEMREWAQTTQGDLVREIASWAKLRKIWIAAGSFTFRGPKQKIRNTSLLFNPKGAIAARYDKMHLFDTVLQDRSYRESQSTLAGKRTRAAATPFGRLGLSICYDIRFPELYRKLRAEVLLIPSAFTVPTGTAHWDALTRARAIENQAYVIAACQTGSPYTGRKTYGHSRIIDPWGTVLSEKRQGEGVILADLSQQKLHEVRSRIPALRHRKIAL